jgi:hypothetical protein
LTNITRLGTQSTCSVFDMTLNQPDSRLIYKADQGFNPDRGIGVWRKPVGGGVYRPDGAQFDFLSGRPYRWNHAQLQTNVMYMLENFFLEPVDPAGTEELASSGVLRLDPPLPNPASAGALLTIGLPQTGSIRLEVLDVTGRRIRTLIGGPMTAGIHTIPWDGRDREGRVVPGGIYWIKLEESRGSLTQKVAIVH